MTDEAAIRRQIASGLRRARRAAGLTLEQAAEKLDRSTSGLQHLEMGRHSVRVEQLPQLARAFGCTVRELLVHMRLVRHQPQQRRGDTVSSTEQTEGRRDGNPGPAAGASADGSAWGDRSTVCDSRGAASHPHPTAPGAPAGASEARS